jgi:hypothetical protein
MGQTTHDPAYADLIEDINGGVAPVSNFPTGSLEVKGVRINNAGLSIIGGFFPDTSAPYAAFVDSDGIVGTSLPLGFPSGYISPVSINDSGLALIGGGQYFPSAGFAAHVLPDGTVTPLSQSTNQIFSTALNSSGLGLIGGQVSLTESYAAYVSGDSLVSTIISGTAGSGIYAVDINEEGTGIVAGYYNTIDPYGAFVYPDLTVVEFDNLPTPPTGGVFYGAAINASGIGLVGGYSTLPSVTPYVAFVSTDGHMTFLDLGVSDVQIISVDLNDTNLGIVGGLYNTLSQAYAAIVKLDGTVIDLLGPGVSGSIRSVSMNSAGVGLIGGNLSGVAYAALVAPNGTLTPLSVQPGSSINSVSLVYGSDTPIQDSVVPSSAGTYMIPLYSQLTCANALENRFVQKNRIWAAKQEKIRENTSLVEIDDSRLEANLAFSLPFRAEEKPPTELIKQNSIWIEPFGNFLYTQKSDSLPDISNQTGGVLLGYERQDTTYLVGVTAAYAYNYAQLSEHTGKVKLQEEALSFYGAYYTEHFWFDIALWGGLYQAKTTRYFIPNLSAEGKPNGWLLDPHLEMATPWALSASKKYVIEPFVQVDWVNNWQDHYTEKGSSGFNLVVPHKYNSMLASEGGVRFYEKFSYGWGDICLEEKISYINQSVFGSTSATVAFIDSPSSFPIAIANGKTRNLGAGRLLANFVPRNAVYPYGGFSFQGSFGTGYQSYFISLFLGQDF